MTEGYVDGGKLEIQVVADLKTLVRQLQTGVPAAAAGVEATIGVNVRTGAGGGAGSKALKTKLKEAAAEASTGVSATVDVDVRTSAANGRKSLKTRLKDAVSGENLSVDVRLNPVATGLKAKLEALAKENKVTITAEVVPAKNSREVLRAARDQAGGEQQLKDALLATREAVIKNETAFKKYKDALRDTNASSAQVESATRNHEAAQNKLNKSIENTGRILKGVKAAEDLNIDTSRAERSLDSIRQRAQAVRETISEVSPTQPQDEVAALKNIRNLDDAHTRLNQALVDGRRASAELSKAEQSLADTQLNSGRGTQAATDAELKRDAALQRSIRSTQGIARAISDLEGAGREINVPVTADTTKARAELDILARNRDVKYTAQLDTSKADKIAADLDAAMRKLQSSTNSAEGPLHNLEIATLRQAVASRFAKKDQLGYNDALLNTANALKKVNAEIAGKQADVTRLRDIGRQTVNIGVEVQAQEAERKLAELVRRRDATVSVEVNDKVAAAKLAALARTRQATLNVDADTGKARGVMQLLSSDTSFAEARILGLAGAIALIGPAIVPIGAAATGALAAIAAGAVAGAAGVGVLVLAFQGVTTAVKAFADLDAATNKDAIKAAKTSAAQQAKVASATDAVTSATDALANARASADNAAASSAERIVSAQQGVVAAERDVTSAERDLADTQVRAKDAQDALTKARQAARQAAEDLALQVRGGAIAQRAAVIDEAKAKKDLDLVLKDPRSTKDAREQAQLAYDRASLSLDEQTVQNKRLQAEQAKSAKVGIDGADGVKTALRGVVQAHRDVGDAQTKVVLQQAKVTEAERAVADARRASANQARQSAASITSAQRGLVTAQRNLAKATTDFGDIGSTAMQKVAKAIGNLSPAATHFAEFLYGLKRSLQDLQQAAGKNLFPGLEKAITALGPYLPGLQIFFEGIGRTLGNLAQEAVKSLGSPVWRQFFDYMSRTAGPFLEKMFGIAQKLGEGFASLLVAFEPVSSSMIAGFERMATSFASWADSLRGSDTFQRFLAYVNSVGSLVVTTLEDMGRALFQIAQSLAPIGVGVLAALDGIFKIIAKTPPAVLYAVALGIMAIVAALIAYNIVTAIAEVETAILEAELLPLTAALLPFIVAVVAAVVGLTAFAAAAIYAYTQSAQMRDTVEGAWQAIGSVVSDISKAITGDTGGMAKFVIGQFEDIAGGIYLLAEGFRYQYFTFIRPLLAAATGDFAALGQVGSDLAIRLDNVTQAERELTDAQTAATKAQDDLNNSRLKGYELLNDLIAQQNQLRLDTKSAALGTKEAVLNLRKVYAAQAIKKKKGQALTEDDQITLERAKLSVEQARQREKDVAASTVKNTAAQGSARAQAAGGTPEVAAAANAAEANRAKAQAQLDTAKAAAKNAGNSLWDSFLHGFIDRMLASFGVTPAVRKWFEDNVLKPVLDFFGIKSPSTVMAAVAADVVAGFLQGLNNAAPSVLGFFLNWPLTLLNAFKTVLGIKSPSTVMAGIGGDVIQGLLDGVTTGALGVVTFFTNLPGRLLGAVSGFGGQLKTWASTAMDTAKTAFDTGVTGIGAAWAKVEGVLSKPVGFVLHTVLEDGLFKAFNSLSSIFPGVSAIHIPKGVLDKFPAAADGAIVPGYTPGRDTGLIAVGGGEAILRPELTRELGSDWVHEGNRAARTGGRPAARRFLGGFADGGLVPQLTAYARKSGVPFNVTSGLRNTNDYHGRGMAIDMAASAPDMIRLASWLYARYQNLLELIHSAGPGFFVKNGQKVAASFYRSVIGEHYNHVHLAMSQAGLAAAGLDPGTAAPGGAFTALVRDKLLGAALDLLPKIGAQGTGLGEVLSGVPALAINTLVDKGGALLDSIPLVGKAADAAAGLFSQLTGTASGLIGKAGSLISSLLGSKDKSGKVDGLPSSVTRWTPLVVQALAELGQSPGLAGAVLRRIKFESGGNPNAINLTDSNAKAGHPSQGLMQTIPSTFAAHAGKYRLLGITNPLANIYAGLDYALKRYGSINAIDPLVRPYGYDSGGVLKPGFGTYFNGTGKPEAVLTNEQFGVLQRIASVPVLPIPGQRGSLGGLVASQLAPRTPPAAGGGTAPIVNVYPREAQSEREIGRIAAREIEWARGAAW